MKLFVSTFRPYQNLFLTGSESHITADALGVAEYEGEMGDINVKHWVTNCKYEVTAERPSVVSMAQSMAVDQVPAKTAELLAAMKPAK